MNFGHAPRPIKALQTGVIEAFTIHRHGHDNLPIHLALARSQQNVWTGYRASSCPAHSGKLPGNIAEKPQKLGCEPQISGLRHCCTPQALSGNTKQRHACGRRRRTPGSSHLLQIPVSRDGLLSLLLTSDIPCDQSYTFTLTHEMLRMFIN